MQDTSNKETAAKTPRRVLVGLAVLLILLFASCLTPGSLGFETPWKNSKRYVLDGQFKSFPLIPRGHRVVIVTTEVPPRSLNPPGMSIKVVTMRDYDANGEFSSEHSVTSLVEPPKSPFGHFREYIQDKQNQLRTQRGEVVPNWP